MAVPKGTRIGGRQKGTPNKSTAKLRATLTKIVENNASKAQVMLNRITDPKDWIEAYAKILPYVVPKISEATIKDDGDSKTIFIKLRDGSLLEV